MASPRVFNDSVCWITGGGTGIGRALALELAQRGANVIVSGRRIEPLQAVVDEIVGAGGQASAQVCDVADEQSIKQAVESIIAEHWRLDVVVANAGFAVAGRIETIGAAEWRRQLDTNVVGLAITAREAIPELRKTRGRLVLVGSVAGMVCAPGSGVYHASKHAVRAIGQVLAMELHDSGISVTTIHPGFVESDIGQTDNKGVYDPDRVDHRPAQLLWTAARAARVMANAIAARKREYVFTGHGRIAGFLGRHTPSLVHYVVTRFGVKNTRES
jgi:NAD(P)-dependent dehydrogenase (short-subunit alcohol dehydrogenase family)